MVIVPLFLIACSSSNEGSIEPNNYETEVVIELPIEKSDDLSKARRAFSAARKMANNDDAYDAMRQVYDRYQLDARMLAILGDNAFKRGLYPEAAEIFDEAVKAIESSTEMETQLSIHRKRAKSCENNNDFDCAIVSIESVVSLLREKDNAPKLAGLYRTLGIYYSKIENIDEAVKYLDLSSAKAVEEKNFSLASNSYRLLASVHKRNKDISKACRSLKSAVSYSEKFENPNHSKIVEQLHGVCD